jgi:CBS domain-containing protein
MRALGLRYLLVTRDGRLEFFIYLLIFDSTPTQISLSLPPSHTPRFTDASTGALISASDTRRATRVFFLLLIFDSTPTQISLSPSLPRTHLALQMRALGLRYLLVTRDGRLVGIIKKKDLLEHMEYHRSLRNGAT